MAETAPRGNHLYLRRNSTGNPTIHTTTNINREALSGSGHCLFACISLEAIFERILQQLRQILLRKDGREGHWDFLVGPTLGPELSLWSGH